jgi:hypothetical protein
MNEFEKACHQWVETGDWKDFYKIFSTENHLTFDYVNDYCSKLGRAYPSWLTKSTKLILYNLKELIEKYNEGESTCTLSEEYNIPRTTLQGVLSPLLILRDRHEAFNVAIEKGRIQSIDGGYCGDSIGYHLDEIVYLRSSYELAYLQQLKSDPDITSIQFEKLAIPYKDHSGLSRTYIPDFKISFGTRIEVHEVKPQEFLEDEFNKLKFEAAKAYCESKGWIFRIITENEIDWNLYPNWGDTNIVNQEEYAKLIQKPDGFITHIYQGTYDYKEHPLTNHEVTYSSIMDYINSKPKYSVTIYDIYDIISRNGIITRLRDEAPEDEKDIRRWMCKYLADVAMNNTAFDLIKLEYQTKGIRDFGLKTENDIRSYLESRGREVSIGDVYEVLGYTRNKALRYTYDVLKIDPYEIVEEINNKLGYTSSSI